jgi:hypothetical protein
VVKGKKAEVGGVKSEVGGQKSEGANLFELVLLNKSDDNVVI